MSEETKTENGNGTPNHKWRSRRRLTIATFCWSVIKTLLIFYTIPVEKLEVLTQPIVWSYFIEGGIICAYMGFKSFAKDQMSM